MPRAADVRTPQDACLLSADAIATNPQDLPFAAIYLADDEGFALAATTGIPRGHPAAPERIGAEATGPLARALAGAGWALVEDLSFAGQADLPSGAWDHPVTRMAVFPFAASAESRRAGALVTGLNPFRMLDEPYRGFLSLVAGQIGTAIANGEAYEKERRRAEALAEIDRAKTAFFSNVSHEFRTPLTLMLGPLEDALAEPPGLPPDQHRRLDTAHRNALRLLRLVNSLLDFSRIEAGRVKARFRPTDLDVLTADLASAFRAATDRAGLQLRVETPPLRGPVHVDREMWEKIVLNLLSNAFKATFSGEIVVRLEEAGGMARLTVQDTGTGIPATELPRLFERFHRVEGARGRSHEGTGIGLALVGELVRQHGGTIEVDSELDRGTTFTIDIPFGAAHLPADQLAAAGEEEAAPTGAQSFVEEALRWLPNETAGGAVSETEIVGAIPSPESAPDPGGPQQHIVLADDNADLRDYIGRLLGERGYLVHACADGEAALAAIRARRPDLVVTDVMMPRMDGFGLLRALRGDPQLRDLSVIMLSARSGEEARVEGLDAGADDYLIKPFSARELIARVESHLAMSRLRQASMVALRESEERFRNMADHSPLMMWVTDASGLCSYLNRSWYEFTGQSEAEATGIGWLQAVHPEDRGWSAETFQAANSRHEAFRLEYRLRHRDGSYRWAIDAAAPRFGPDGTFLGYIGSVLDIDERKQQEALRQQQNRLLGTLNRTAAALAAELDLERLVQMVTDAGVELTGARFGAFFYNVADRAGGSYTLYTLAGVDRSAFENFPMPRNTKVFAPTFEGVGTVRSSDITADPRYGQNDPYRGMPEGHLPVRSYLAVPVISRTGEVLGGLFFGHPEAGRFSDGHEQLMEGIAGQAAVAIDNARLYQAAQSEIGQRAAAEAALKELNEQLEMRVAEEIAERRQAEQALQQAQRMEAIGQLTGGVAHDFNNLLQVISGNLQMLTKDVAGNDRAERRVQNALTGVSRGAKLASQLLAFGRRQPLEPKIVNVGRFVRGLDDMLRRTLGEEIEIETTVSGGLWNTFADPGQIENALLNLAINARDAMDGHGKLTIEVGNAFLDDDYARAHADLAPGQYVMLAVTDTGAGMTPEIMDKVFEPFFTTKPEGRGTGLGLSMVYGFAKQSGGHVKIYSEVGHGTTIRLYLPRSTQSEDVIVEVEQQPVGGGSETVLVVEDDDEVRATAVDLLTELGYRVLKAPEATSALAIIESGIAVDLLFTDVVMPGKLRSPELARKARERLPGIAILFTSGYTENAIVHGGRLDEGLHLLAKPYTREALARKIRYVLANREQADAPAARLAQPALPTAPAGRTLTVLLVENDAAALMATAAMLQSLGHTVLEAGSHDEAVSLLQRSTVDVLVAGAGRPGQSGMDLAARARAVLPEVGIVFATDAAGRPEPASAVPEGAVLLAKPYDLADLADCLQQWTTTGDRIGR